MYEDFLRSLLLYIEALNGVERQTDQMTGSIAVLGNKIPVECEGEVVGYLVDEIGGAWSYQPSDPREGIDAPAH